MNFFNNNPFVKILSFELLGILLFKSTTYSTWAICLLMTIFAIWSIRLVWKEKIIFDAVYSSFLGMVIIFLTVVSCRFNHETVTPTQLGKQFFIARILEKPTQKANSFQTILKISKSDSAQLENKKILAYFEKNNQTEKLNAGDLIFVHSFINPVKNQGNPFEFDYKSYLARQNIHYTTYIKLKNYSPISSSSFNFGVFSENIRNKLIDILRVKLPDQQIFQVVSALTLGYRKELTPETRSYFTTTGAMHVLAVSGLHVGMIFMFLSWAFSFVKRLRGGSAINFVIIGTCLWIYAWITGFSPSVQRATVMFTFILIGSNLRRPTSVYNSIAASAFILLLINPNLLFEVGFQLSYMAVISIVFFYPKFEKLARFRYHLLTKGWQLLCVSLAAQIGTFPLSIFYFHQFPTFFWLSNFVVIPAAYLILGLTFSLFFVYPFTAINSGIAWVLTQITKGTLFLLKDIGKLPGALIEGITISQIQLTLLIALLGILLFFIKLKRSYLFFGMIVLFLLFHIFGFLERVSLFNQRKLIIYQSKEPLIHLVNGRKNYLFPISDTLPSPFLYSNAVLKLKLNKPIILTQNQREKNQFDDLRFYDQTIQFTDKLIFLPSNRVKIDSIKTIYTSTESMIDLDTISESGFALSLN